MTGPHARPLAGLAAAALLLLVHFSSFEVHEAPLVTDVRYFVYFAWRVSQGAVPHLDFFDNKTQLASLFGGALFGVGEHSGDPLLLLRISYMTLAALTAGLAYAIHRRISGSPFAGLLAVTAFCAFPLLVYLPSIGNVPKLIMALSASLAGLCVYSGRWFWAGVAAAVAFMDWQVGALIGVGAMVAALLDSQSRLRSAALVLAGGVAGLLPFLVYYAANDALGTAVDQTIISSFFRGQAALGQTELPQRIARIIRMTRASAPHSYLLLYVIFLGIPLAGIQYRRLRGTAAGRMLLALSIHHVGVIGFSLTDYQGYGDLLILLHSVIFFVALGYDGVREVALASLARGLRLTARGRLAAEIALLAAALLIARPGPMGPAEPIPIRGVANGTTLKDQVQVAHRVAAELGDGKLLFLDHVELAHLLRYQNPLLFSFWNPATWAYARQDDGESMLATAKRLIEASDPDAYLATRRASDGPLPGYSARTYASENGLYHVEVYVREELGAAARPSIQLR